jgi:ribosomal protein S18 acetylase RimI-like enzyme
MFTIRKLIKNDDEDLFFIVKQYNPCLKAKEFKENLNLMLDSGYWAIGVFNENNTLIAIIGIWINTRFWCDKYLEIDNFIVDQGNLKKGIGKMMMDHILQIAKGNQVNSVLLNVYNNNQIAAEFYKNQGFEDIGNFLKLGINNN